MTSRRSLLAEQFWFEQAALVRELHDRDEAGGLGKGQILRVDAVVALCGRLDAVGVVAEEGDIEVGGQDLLLRVGLLQTDCQLHLLELAVEGRRRSSVVRLLTQLLSGFLKRLLHVDVLDQLHRQGRGTAGGGAGCVAQRGTDHRRDIHATVVEEAPVLAVDGSIQGVRRDLVERTSCRFWS